MKNREHEIGKKSYPPVPELKMQFLPLVEKFSVPAQSILAGHCIHNETCRSRCSCHRQLTHELFEKQLGKSSEPRAYFLSFFIFSLVNIKKQELL